MDVIPMWPGDIIRIRLSEVYLQQRDMMSNAAKYGKWDEVMELLEVARYAYGENWANVVRLKHPQVADKVSFWTPLHQAAYLCAPINVIRYLIANGSLRTLRTRNSDTIFKHRDLTAAEIARENGYLHLIDILAPVIYYPVPHSTLARLQALFHEMIRADSRGVSNLVLPELVTLTELRIPEMWFPLKHKSAKEHAVGYRYRLDNRELVVVKLCIEKKSPSVYRISEGVAAPIQRPIISNE
ncbi:hypothetical protein DM02DRAFT_730649 [Periconia macrospinosa]|uniref:Ankyrin n=1 Tax=Periconia macrospinosa TaxID=97972 RepID=A0A2V1DH17_9PLEO|nr:hypothetical protein DM02DRAFT_730649 [Periconia macrospinosa]